MNEIMTISGVECYEKNGTAYLKLESVARGLGFTRIANSGNEVVMWSRVEGYLNDLGVHTCAHDDFIPENIFYRLAMKAKNETAEKFQALVADEIIPSIRKHGGYLTEQKVDEILSDPDTIIKLATELKATRAEKKRIEAEKKALEVEAIEMNKTISQMQPKVDYVDTILKSKATVCITQIAQDYGMSAKAFNKVLRDFGVQHKVAGQWILYGKYLKQGYVQSETVEITRRDGTPDTVMNTKWTTKGRLFLYELLKDNDIYPLIERQGV